MGARRLSGALILIFPVAEGAGLAEAGEEDRFGAVSTRDQPCNDSKPGWIRKKSIRGEPATCWQPPPRRPLAQVPAATASFWRAPAGLAPGKVAMEFSCHGIPKVSTTERKCCRDLSLGDGILTLWLAGASLERLLLPLWDRTNE